MALLGISDAPVNLDTLPTDGLAFIRSYISTIQRHIMGILIKNIISEAEKLLELQPEELTGPLLKCLNFLSPKEEERQLNRYSYVAMDALQCSP